MKRSIAFLLFCATAGIAQNRPPLQAAAFQAAPLGAVQPKGWLLDQLRIQASGLSGHVDEFWPDLGPNSGWLGGTGESWERGPYFLDGLVPLAYLTKDPKLIAKVQRWMNWTLDHQGPDGHLGPVKNTDWWPNYVMIKALIQFQEVTGDRRVIPVLEKYFAYQAKHLDERPLKEWAIYRWQDEVLSLIWLYNHNGDRSLLDLAGKMHQQGYDWAAQFTNFKYPGKVSQNQADLKTHGVNNAMALKTDAVWWLVTGKVSDREALSNMLGKLDEFDRQPNGMFASDEHYGGTDPSQGTELCTVVEAMFSLETDEWILGDPLLSDRLEKIAFNALPGTMTADLWAHQYDQQANQVMCSLSKRAWSTNGPESNIFGLEPNFGCCTANMHQGWPKLAENLWMRTPSDGFAVSVYSPSSVTGKVHDVAVTIDEQTDYPFRETVDLTVRPASAVTFDLQVRIPAWAEHATVAVDGKEQEAVIAGSYLKIEREWKAGDRVAIRFPMTVRTSHWYHNSVAVERGPLVYSLKIGESWRKEKQTGPAADWEVFPTTPWNYALIVNPDDPASAFQVMEKPTARQPFSVATPPIEIKANGRRVPDWQMVNDSAGPLPQSPLSLPKKAEEKPPREEAITLIPYGAAKLRITAFPYFLQ